MSSSGSSLHEDIEPLAAEFTPFFRDILQGYP